jgi:hypothetical protein
MWNLIYNPAENGALLMPVSRDWSFAPGPVDDVTGLDLGFGLGLGLGLEGLGL